MNRSNKLHLDSFSIQDMEDWKNETARATIASSDGPSGHVSLGVNGNGVWIVSCNGKITTCLGAEDAKHLYSSYLED